MKRTIFRGWLFPTAFLAPQLLISLIFFFWPAGQAVRESFYTTDTFGLEKIFVGFDNFTYLFHDPSYLSSFITTIIFSASTAGLSLILGFCFAIAVDRVRHGQGIYTTLFLWPYAIAPAIAGVLWMFLFNPSIGIVAKSLHTLGISWNPLLNGTDALFLTIVAASWKQIAYNFIFFLAGLQSIPRSLIEAAAIDGASPWQRLRSIIIPLLSPTVFFLLVMNLIYAFFETFGVIHAVTEGGPGQATMTLVYKSYVDGVVHNDFSSSAAQSVILTLIVLFLTVIQFRYVERRVHY